jgi:hypothetical protein
MKQYGDIMGYIYIIYIYMGLVGDLRLSMFILNTNYVYRKKGNAAPKASVSLLLT